MDKNKRRLGEVIESQRHRLGMTQRQLAREVNINHATISKIERNPDIVADPSTLKAIAQALKLDYNFLLSLNNTIEDDKDIRIIARASKSMSEPEKEKMMDFLRQEFSEAFKDADSDGFIDSQESDDY